MRRAVLFAHLPEVSGSFVAAVPWPSMRSQSAPQIDACFIKGALARSAFDEIVTSNREQAKFG